MQEHFIAEYENKEEMINAVKNYNNNIKVIFADE